MKNFTVLLLLNLFLISVGACQEATDNKKQDLTGTWVYTQPAEEELGFTMTVDGKKINTQPENREEDRYFLIFDGEDNLIEYKVVFGFRSKYKVENHTLYIDQQPAYEITELTSDSLTLRYLQEPKRITYSKTNEEVSDIPIMN